MVKALTSYPLKVYGRIILIITTLLVTNFLFYIDEGYYDFRWMRDAGNWIVFLIYLLPMLLVQLIVFEVVYKFYRLPGRVLISLLAAWAVTFLLVARFAFGL